MLDFHLLLARTAERPEEPALGGFLGLGVPAHAVADAVAQPPPAALGFVLDPFRSKASRSSISPTDSPSRPYEPMLAWQCSIVLLAVRQRPQSRAQTWAMKSPSIPELSPSVTGW